MLRRKAEDTERAGRGEATASGGRCTCPVVHQDQVGVKFEGERDGTFSPGSRLRCEGSARRSRPVSTSTHDGGLEIQARTSGGATVSSSRTTEGRTFRANSAGKTSTCPIWIR